MFSLKSWVRRLQASRQPNRTPITRRTKHGLRVESLEDRVTPAAPAIEWVDQFGSSNPQNDFARAVDADGNVYIAGQVAGALPGEVSVVPFDAFLRKYDATGNVLWTSQFGTTSHDEATGVAVAPDGSVYVSGRVDGALPGQFHAGGADAFVRKYDAAGNAQWTRQFGTPGSDIGWGVAVATPQM